MLYLTESDDIRLLINKFASAEILWLDTEIADWHTPYSRLSLIQLLANSEDLTGDFAYILDVIDKPNLVADFVNQIMANPKVEKVFHNASYDLRFLSKEQAQNVTCTLKLAKSFGAEILGVTDLKLKTLAAELCHFSSVDKMEQGSDWGQRPLTKKQLHYAKMDTVYLAQVHHRLLAFIQKDKSSPVSKTTNLENPSFSATKVRVAFECPRLFYLNQHFGGKTLFSPKNHHKGIGSAFHKLAEELIDIAKREPRLHALFELPVEQLNVEAITSQMQQLFFELSFYPYLQAAIQEDPAQATALHQIWQGLTKLIRYWTELLIRNRRYCNAENLIHNTFIAQELVLEHNFALPNGSQQRLVGKLDGLVFNFEQHRLYVMEYKTYEPIDPSAQLAQVALYSYMLWEKKKVPVDSAVYCVLPEFKEYSYSWEQLENTVHQLIPHKLQQMQQWLTWEPSQPNPPPPTTQPERLCDICPQRKKCQTFFVVDGSQSDLVIAQPDPKAIPQPTKPEVVVPRKLAEVEKPQTVKAETSQQEKKTSSTSIADGMGKDLVATLQSFGVGVDYQGATVGPAFIRVKLKPHAGVKVSSILKLSDDLRVQLGLSHSPLIAPQAGYLSVDLPRPDRQVASFEQYIQSQVLPFTAPMKVSIGVNLEGQLVEADLSDPNTCHFLVGGTTGSGKSEFLRSLLLSLLIRHSPSQLKVALVDPKRVTFPEFERMAWLYTDIVKDSDRATEFMNELVTEMDRRYQRFEHTRCADVSTYNQQVSNRPSQLLPRIVCIFDEYADFMAEKEIRNALELSIKRLGAMARAAGIHLIIATQRPEAKVVTPLIRSNLPGRVALRTASEADSMIVLGSKQTAAAYLLGKGDLLYQSGAHLLRLQSLFASKSTAVQIQQPS